MDQNVELQEDMGLSTGRLDSDMRTSLLDCTLLVSTVYPSRYPQPLPRLLYFSLAPSALLCSVYASPGLLCVPYRYCSSSALRSDFSHLYYLKLMSSYIRKCKKTYNKT